ncbi:MAG: hypothetical protein QOI46_5055 [Alphaproteobacteria bacterium]|nr:hypothetical protein [Alphaproteobacteria bacterium]
MTRFEDDSASIYFEEHGSGFPLLLIAPGALNSTIEMWANATIDPLELDQDTFRMIAMDQRNAGRSYGQLDLSDPWGAYARDQLALLDPHLGIHQFHVMGCCIGGSFAVLALTEDYRAWLTALITDLSRAAGAANPKRLAQQLALLYDGAAVAARLDADRAGAADAARSAATALLDAATVRQRRRPTRASGRMQTRV